MAMKIVKYNTLFTRSLPPAVAHRDTLLEGVLAGIVAGEYVPATYTASGAVPARGFVVQGVQRKNNLGTVTGYDARVTIAREAVVEKEDWALTVGATYYLHTGGGISLTDPSSATTDLKQVVGYAESATVLVGCVSDEVKHA